MADVVREFDILLSFAGPERPYAQSLHAILARNGLRVFLDEEYQHEIWGENLVEYLDRTYRERGLYCLILISEEYRKRAYTKVERRAAFDRMINQDRVYILPVKVDDAWIDGLPKSTGFLDLRRQGIVGVAEAVLKKTGRLAARDRLEIPPDVAVPRVPAGMIPAEHLTNYLLEFCQRQPVCLFGAVLYDDRHAEIRHLFMDRAYWDALNAASGSDFEVFVIRDEEHYEFDGNLGVVEMVTASSMGSSRSRGWYYSKFLKEYFDKEKTRLAYPSVILFIVEAQRISNCRLIPLRRGTIEEVFLRLQELFQVIADETATWKQRAVETRGKLWDALKSVLIAKDYTVYIQSTPGSLVSGVKALTQYMKPSP